MNKRMMMVALVGVGLLGGVAQAEEGFSAQGIEQFLVGSFAGAEQMHSKVYTCERLSYYGGLYVRGDKEGERLLGVSPYVDNPAIYALFKELATEHGYDQAHFDAMRGQCQERIAKVGHGVQVAAK